eukprot:Rhum_TRINITY_DN8995_c0_g1::Rhum_TRINITY_DN8995_c0_g1_i1::g.30999::m.30999
MTVADCDRLADACEQRFAVVEAAALRHAEDADLMRAAQAQYTMRFKAEAARYLFVIKELKADRTVLADEVRDLRAHVRGLSARLEQAAAARAQVAAAPPALVHAARAAAGDAAWRAASAERRAGMVAAAPRLLQRAEEAEAAGEAARAAAERRAAAAVADADSLRRDLEVTKKLAEARLTQIKDERTKRDESHQQAAVLKRELAEMSFRMDDAASDEDTAATAGVESLLGAGSPLLAAAAAPGGGGGGNALEGAVQHPHLLMLLESGGGGCGVAPGAAAASPLLSQSLLRGRRFSGVLDASASSVGGDGKGGSGSAGGGGGAAAAATASSSGAERVESEAVATLMEKCRQLADENEELKLRAATTSSQIVAQQTEAIEAIQKEREGLAGLRERVELQKILNDTRHDIELYRDRQHAKRLALAELLAAAELAEATAQEERDRERERLKGAEHELELLREQLDSRPLQATPIEIFEADVLESEKRVALVMEESDDRPRFEILFPPPAAPEKPDVEDAGTQAPSIGACPRHMWEPGAPTPADVAAMGDRDRELTVILRMTLPETHVQHSTIVKIADTKTVQELLDIVCERLRRKVGVSMDARTLALSISEGDQRATLEWSDPEKEVYLFPEDADAAMPPTLAGSPRKDAAAFAEEHRRTKSYVAEHPCSDRPLRTLAYVHENYPPDFLVLEDLQARVWFTVKPAAHPLYPKETEARMENIAFSTMVNVKIASSKLLKSVGRTPSLNDVAPLASSRRSRGGSASAREGSQHSSPRDEGLGGGGGGGGDGNSRDDGASSSSRPERLPQPQSSLLGASLRDDARSLSSAGTSGSESDGNGRRRRRRGGSNGGGSGRGGSAGSTLTVPLPASARGGGGGGGAAARRASRTGSP